MRSLPRRKSFCVAEALPFSIGPPVVEVVEGIQARFAGFDEPRMFVARMIDDQIEYEFHSPEMDFGEQVVEIVHRAEIGHDPR